MNPSGWWGRPRIRPVQHGEARSLQGHKAIEGDADSVEPEYPEAVVIAGFTRPLADRDSAPDS